MSGCNRTWGLVLHLCQLHCWSSLHADGDNSQPDLGCKPQVPAETASITGPLALSQTHLGGVGTICSLMGRLTRERRG